MATLQNFREPRAADLLPAFFVLVVGAIFGGSMAVLTPPFNVPEEQQHFYRAYQCSEGIIYSERDGSGKSAGGEIPASLHDIVGLVLGNPSDEFHLQISLENVAAAMRMPLEPDRRVFCGFPVAVRYSPISYVPASAALFVGRCLDVSALMELYFARIATLAAYLALVVAAVWLVPVQKWTMAMIALMPMSIFLAASTSADAVTVGLSLLTIAMILRLALGEGPIAAKGLYWLQTVLLLLALAKPAYVLINLLFLAVPAARFSSRTRCWLARACMIAVPWAVGAAWVLSIRNIAVPLLPWVDVPAQAHWIMGHPQKFLEMLVTRLTWRDLYTGLIATLGWGTIFLAPAVYVIYWAGLIATAVFDGSRDETRLRLSTRVGGFALYVLVMSTIATLTYLTWHAVGDTKDGIHGVCPRYFLPVLPLLLLPLRNRAGLALGSGGIARWFAAATAVAVVLIGMGATWQVVIERHYLH